MLDLQMTHCSCPCTTTVFRGDWHLGQRCWCTLAGFKRLSIRFYPFLNHHSSQALLTSTIMQEFCIIIFVTSYAGLQRHFHPIHRSWLKVANGKYVLTTGCAIESLQKTIPICYGVTWISIRCANFQAIIPRRRVDNST